MNETLLSYIQAPNIINRNSVLDNKSHVNKIGQNRKVIEEYRQKEGSILEQNDIVSISYQNSDHSSEEKEEITHESENMSSNFKSFEEELKVVAKSSHIDIKV